MNDLNTMDTPEHYLTRDCYFCAVVLYPHICLQSRHIISMQLGFPLLAEEGVNTQIRGFAQEQHQQQRCHQSLAGGFCLLYLKKTKRSERKSAPQKNKEQDHYI